MTPKPKPDTVLDDIRELCIEFFLPAMVIVITGALLWTGRDAEVKTIFAMAAGWLFKSGIARNTVKK